MFDRVPSTPLARTNFYFWFKYFTLILLYLLKCLNLYHQRNMDLQAAIGKCYLIITTPEIFGKKCLQFSIPLWLLSWKIPKIFRTIS